MHTPLSAIYHFSNHDISINMAMIDDALAVLETQEQPNYKDTAKRFGVDRSRLYNIAASPPLRRKRLKRSDYSVNNKN